MQPTGIGPALRRARLTRGKSIEEASRETRIRVEYLQALERESFATFLGDVYVRGFLRSYSTYLGLDADKVLKVYNEHFGPPRTTLPGPAPGPARSEKKAHPHWFPLRGHPPTWVFAAGVAILAIVVFAAAGLFRSRNAPPAEQLPSIGPVATSPLSIAVGLVALRQVQAIVVTDGTRWEGTLSKGEQRSFQGESRIQLRLSQGHSVEITVNDHALGAPGLRSSPYVATFLPHDYRRSTSPSPSASAAA